MKHEFWHQIWEDDEIGFHINMPNPLLLKHFEKLKLDSASRVFIPLCGKTLDMHWLLAEGFQVVGAELSEIAIQQLFEELKLIPKMTELGTLKHYKAKNIDIFVGDFFDVNADLLGKVDAVYDRGSLVALPKDMRISYAQHLQLITNNVPQLVLCFEYDQNLREGPPFSISEQELAEHYAANYSLLLAEELDARDKLGVDFVLVEKVWLLSPN